MPLSHAIRVANLYKSFDIVKETMQIINANGYYLLALIRLQMQEGKDADDKPVFAKYGPFYADQTVFNKERHGVGLGKNVEWVTNYMTGRFYNSLQVVTTKNTFGVESDVDYFQEILNRSGPRILQLNKKHLEEFETEILQPQLRERLKNHLNGI